MLFSCKISHSILTYLDRQGADLGTLFEACEYPAEFLRNPSHWLEAEKMEDLLAFFMRECNRLSRDGHLIQEAGHQCKDLRAWGVLDSVLRMVQSPKDIFAQPDRFISYFVRPAPPVGNILREPDAIFFELPIASSQYPLVTEYLRAALEALPTYVSKPMATATWSEIRVSVTWAENQESLFGEGQAPQTHLNPEILQNILHNLEMTQKQLEETKQQLADREQELKTLKGSMKFALPLAARQSVAQSVKEAGMMSSDSSHSGLATTNASGSDSDATDGSVTVPMTVPSMDMAPNLLSSLSSAGAIESEAIRWRGLAQGLKAEISGPAQDVLNHLYRMNDYMARSQQLVTLLVGQGRETPQVREAMRRVDWPFVLRETPMVVKQAAAGIRKIQETIKDLGLLASERERASERASESASGRGSQREQTGLLGNERKVPTNLNQLVAKAVESVQAETGGNVQVDQHLLLDRDVPVHPKPMERAIANLLKNAVQSIDVQGTVRVVTRPNGARAEIEISDSGIGMNEMTIARATEPFFTTQTPGTAAGLGLSLAQSIIRGHDGGLTLTSQPGRGTTVVVSLPMSP